MGTLRTLFAIAVVLGHSLGYLLVGGRNAVQLFYMISGFLISYVLVELKVYPNLRSFYINRYLRLYPIYFFVALLTLMTFFLIPAIGNTANFFDTYSTLPESAYLLLIISNLTLFFQDWILFFGVEAKKLMFIVNLSTSGVALWHGLLVPQAWTLGVELTFYLLAPFILFKKYIFIPILLGSILLRIYLVFIGLGTEDPWTYRFFPTELSLFLLGALAHQLLMPIYLKRLGPRISICSKLATFFLIIVSLIFSFIPLGEVIKSIALFSIFFLLLPLTFIFQENFKWDRWIGDLSYPIYISHMFVLYCLSFLAYKMLPYEKFVILGKSVPLDRMIVGIGTVILSIGLAILLNKFVSAPMELFRNKFRSKVKLRQ